MTHGHFSFSFTFHCKLILSFGVILILGLSSARAQQSDVVVNKRRPVQKAFFANAFNIAGLNYTETTKINIAGRDVPTAIQTFGLSLSYTWFYLTPTYRVSVEPLLEILSSHVTDKESAVRFSQSYVPTYATGLDVGWPFYYSRKSLVASIGARARYRLVDFKKIQPDDEFKDRTKLLYDLNLKTYFSFSNNFSLLQDIALSPQYGLGLRFGASWSWR